MDNNHIKLVNGTIFTLHNKFTFLYENNTLHEVHLKGNEYEKTGKTYSIKEANRLIYTH